MIKLQKKSIVENILQKQEEVLEEVLHPLDWNWCPLFSKVIQWAGEVQIISHYNNSQPVPGTTLSLFWSWTLDMP